MGSIIVTTLAGGGSATGTTAGAADGTGREATFNGPTSLAIDPSGTNLYISEFTNNLIRKIVIATGVVTTVAGGGSPGGTTPGNSNGTGTAATFNGPRGLAINRSNTCLYVADAGNNLIRKIVLSTGVVTTIAGGTNVWGITAGFVNDLGIAARFKAPTGLAIIGDEFLYVADYNNSAIRQIDLATGMVTTILAGGSFVTGPKGMVFDTNGNLLYTDVGQSDTSPFIRKLIPVAFSISPALPTGLTFDTSTGNISGTPSVLSPATSYTIMAANSFGGNKAAVSIAVTSNADPMLSNLVASSGTMSPTFDAATTAFTLNVLYPASTITLTPTINNTGASATLALNGGTATAVTSGSSTGSLNLNVGTNTISIVVTAADGATTRTYTITVNRAIMPPAIGYTPTNSFVVNRIITQLTPVNTGGTPSKTIPMSSFTFAGGGAANDTVHGHADGTGVAATFYHPAGLALDWSGNLYVSDYGNNLIRKIDSLGVVTTLAGGGSVGGNAAGNIYNVTGTEAKFNGPWGIDIDNTRSRLYVADKNNHQIKWISLEQDATLGYVANLIGSGVSSNANTFTANSGANAILNSPQAVRTNSTNNILYLSTGGAQIIVVNCGTGYAQKFLGTSSGSAVNSTGTNARFRNPWGLAFDSISFKLYISDQGNHKIRQSSTPAGVVTALAGGASAGYLDDTGATALFNTPYGQALDKSKANIYVADYGNNLIRKVNITSTVVTTFAGGGTPYRNTAGRTEGVGTEIMFNKPVDVAVDKMGNVYVADYGNNLIRKIPSGYRFYKITPDLPAGLTMNTTTGAITGTPTAVSAQTTYTITTGNSGGTSTASLSLAVVIPSSDATLSNLVPGIGSFDQSFDPTTISYTQTVANATIALSLTPTANAGSVATIMVNGASVISDSASDSITLNVGNNTITTVVTAQDGTTTKTYTVTVVRTGLPSVNRYGQLTTGNDRVDRYGRVGGDSGVNLNGKTTP